MAFSWSAAALAPLFNASSSPIRCFKAATSGSSPGTICISNLPAPLPGTAEADRPALTCGQRPEPHTSIGTSSTPDRAFELSSSSCCKRLISDSFSSESSDSARASVTSFSSNTATVFPAARAAASSRSPARTASLSCRRFISSSASRPCNDAIACASASPCIFNVDASCSALITFQRLTDKSAISAASFLACARSSSLSAAHCRRRSSLDCPGAAVAAAVVAAVASTLIKGRRALASKSRMRVCKAVTALSANSNSAVMALIWERSALFSRSSSAIRVLDSYSTSYQCMKRRKRTESTEEKSQ